MFYIKIFIFLCKLIAKYGLNYSNFINMLLSMSKKYLKKTYNLNSEFILNENIEYFTKNIKHKDVVVIIKGGGFLIDSCCDVLIANNILDNFNNLSVISINYPLNTCYEIIKKSVYNSFRIIVESGFNVKTLIGESVGGYLCLELLKKFTIKSVYLISPVIKFDIQPNYGTYITNINNDIIDYYAFTYVLDKYKNNKTIVHKQKINIVICVGTNEILFDDINNYAINNNYKLIVYQNHFHCYYIFNELFLLNTNNIFYNNINNFIKENL